MTYQEFVDGLTILRKYTVKDYCLGADHDIIYFYPTDKPVEEWDLVRLRMFGWFQPDVADKEDGEHGDYDPKEGWAAYV